MHFVWIISSLVIGSLLARKQLVRLLSPKASRTRKLALRICEQRDHVVFRPVFLPLCLQIQFVAWGGTVG